MAITFELKNRLLYRMREKNKWALPSGAKEQIGPKGRSRAAGGT